MRNLHISLIYTLFIILSFSFGQYVDNDINITQYPQGYLIESLSSIGLANNVLSEITTLSSANPASMVDYSNPALGLSWQFESDINLFDDIAIKTIKKRSKSYWPHAFGLVYNFRNIRIGIGANQVYNTKIILGPYERIIMSNSGTDTTSRTDSEEIQIIRSALLFSYSFYNWLQDYSVLTIGFKYTHYYMEDRMNYWGYNNSISINAPGFSVGARYDQNVSKDYKYSMALHYENGAELKEEWIFPVKLVNSTTGDTTRNYYVGIVPRKIDFGVDFSCQTTELLLNTSYLFWEAYSLQTDSALYHRGKKVQNQIEFSGSLIYTCSENLKMSLGLYKSNYSSSYTKRINKSGSALFLTLGSVITLGNIDIDIALADSHLFADKFRRQTIFKSGLMYTLK